MPRTFSSRVHAVARLTVLCLAMAACRKADETAAEASDSVTASAATTAEVARAPETAATRTLERDTSLAAPGKGAAMASRRVASAPAVPPARAAGKAPRRVMLGTLDLTGVGYDRGSHTAPVVMIDFSDFACPYCAEFSLKTYPALEEEYIRTGKVFFKYVPFIMGSFTHAREATRAAECAADQDRFWPMLDRVYGAQREWKQARDPVPILAALAAAEGLDTSRFGECYQSGRTDVRTARATRAADDVGVRVSPSFVVNGHPVQGALPLAEFRKVISGALLLLEAER